MSSGEGGDGRDPGVQHRAMSQDQCRVLDKMEKSVASDRTWKGPGREYGWLRPPERHGHTFPPSPFLESLG